VIADIHNQTNTMLHTNVNLVFQKYSLTVAEKFITEPISRDSRVEVLRKDKEKFRSARKIMRNENRLYGKINMAKKLSWKLCNLSSKR
jgi:ABC-type arginine transport system ATPase subunit